MRCMQIFILSNVSSTINLDSGVESWMQGMQWHPQERVVHSEMSLKILIMVIVELKFD